jgi:hypothetical protein
VPEDLQHRLQMFSVGDGDVVVVHGGVLRRDPLKLLQLVSSGRRRLHFAHLIARQS